VHSKEQMRASVESGGKALPQFSQTGRSSSMRETISQVRWFATALTVGWPDSFHRRAVVLSRIPQRPNPEWMRG
jgi:hypothetical protein